jgi:subtilisin family serine protease
MPSRVAPPFRSARTAFAIAAIVLGGCVPATRGVETHTSVVASAGSTVASVPTAFVESQTVSFALDRIDQRSLPLDQTYRHFGTGSGVTVYVFDGGILETHPELAGRVRRGFDAFPGEEHVCNAHGTAVAGAVAGTTRGVAPKAEIVDVKMVECRRLRGTIDAIVQGAKWTIADHARHPERPAIANWSFIADTAATIPALDSAVRELRAAGIPVVVSAGNVEMNACRIAPANSPGVIVVGASRIRRAGIDPEGQLVDARTPGTAYGPCLDVFAPGDSVLLPSMEGTRQPTTQLWTGTSMSAGYVSGAIALYLEAHPSATPDAVSDYIHAASRFTIVDPTRSPKTGLLYLGSERQGPERQRSLAAR